MFKEAGLIPRRARDPVLKAATCMDLPVLDPKAESVGLTILSSKNKTKLNKWSSGSLQRMQVSWVFLEKDQAFDFPLDQAAWAEVSLQCLRIFNSAFRRCVSNQTATFSKAGLSI